MRTDFIPFGPTHTHTHTVRIYIRFIYTEQGRPGRITTDLKRPVYTRDYVFYTVIIIIFYRVQGAAIHSRVRGLYVTDTHTCDCQNYFVLVRRNHYTRFLSFSTNS